MGTVSGSGCTPIIADAVPGAHCCKPIVEPLNDKECANIILVQSVIRDDLTDVTRALDMGASVNTVADLMLGMGPPGQDVKKSMSVTPLMRAAALGHVDVMRKLVERGAFLSKKDSRGWSPLCYALGACELEAARLIIAAAGSDADARLALLQVAQAVRPAVLKECGQALGDEAAERVRQEIGPPGLLLVPADQPKSAVAVTAAVADVDDACPAAQVADAAKCDGTSVASPAPGG